jgi:hypothetical protein
MYDPITKWWALCRLSNVSIVQTWEVGNLFRKGACMIPLPNDRHYVGWVYSVSIVQTWEVGNWHCSPTISCHRIAVFAACPPHYDNCYVGWVTYQICNGRCSPLTKHVMIPLGQLCLQLVTPFTLVYIITIPQGSDSWGHNEPAPTGAPSTGCSLLLSCGWTSTEFIFGFKLGTNSVGNRSHT